MELVAEQLLVTAGIDDMWLRNQSAVAKKNDLAQFYSNLSSSH